jgi:signal transduction histidine kinase
MSPSAKPPKSAARETRLAELESRLREITQAHDIERQLIAFEIHDGLVQYIAGALMQLESIDVKQSSAEQLQAALDHVASLLRSSIGDARRVLAGLRPPILDEHGVAAAVGHLVDEARRSGIEVEYAPQITSERLEPLLEGALFRIAQESLSNVRRHSGARRATVELVQSGERIDLVVRDWGCGFVPERVAASRFGLCGIRKRAELLGGRATIESTPGEGTSVIAELPCMQ